LAAVFVRLPLTAAFVAVGVAVVPPGALEGAGFRVAAFLDLDLDVVLILFASMRPDMRIARLCANLWRSDRAVRIGDTLRVDKCPNPHRFSGEDRSDSRERTPRSLRHKPHELGML
jgi:hypothetical protein